MRHPKAVFSFAVIAKNLIVIRDTNEGKMSVTNDIENVIAYISEVMHYTPESKVWVYQDSQGRWDGFDPIAKDFYFLGIEESNIDQQIIKSPEVQSRLNQLSNEM